MNTYEYQVRALERTTAWARRCLSAHSELTRSTPARPRQALFAVIQGAQYEDLRRRSARELSGMVVDGRGFEGFGIGGALEKPRLGEIVGWVTDELPEDRPRHLLGIGDPDDLFTGIEAGADTFDCVAPSRVARNAAVHAPTGRFNITGADYRRQFVPVDDTCDCYTCTHYTRAYLHHAFKSREMIAFTLATIHNERFIVGLVDRIREAIAEGDYREFKREFLGRYYGRVMH